MAECRPKNYPKLKDYKPSLQFQRTGYFTADKNSTPEHPIFNRTVGLKDTWAKQK